MLVACAALLVACLTPTLTFQFSAWDDPLHVTRNPAVQTPGEAPLRAHLLTPQLGYPIPVTVASFTLNRAVLGPGPAGFHAVNALLHLSVCALWLALARRFGLSRTAATCGVVLFGLHPVVAEPVSWVTGRKDLLAALFSLSALWLALPGRRLAYAGSVACYALALLSKPVAAPIALLCAAAPIVGVAATSQPEAPSAPRRAIARLVPYLIVLAPIAILGFRGQSAVGSVDSGGYDGLSQPRAAWYALGHHVSLVLFMEEPTVKYTPAGWPPSLLEPRTTAATLLLALAIALGALKMRGHTRRVAAFGLAWAALAYLPSSNLLFPIVRFLADSFMYLPMLGLAWSFGALVDAVAAGLGTAARRAAVWLPLALAVALAPPFLLSSARFTDDVELWSHARQRFPHQPRICRQWANAITGARGTAPGLEATEACIGQFGDALFAKNRGVLLLDLGRYAEARASLTRALAHKPGDAAIQRLLQQADAAVP